MAELPAILGQSLSRAQARQLIMAGAVRLGVRPVRRPGWTPEPGTRLHVEVRLEDVRRSGPARDRPLTLSAQIVLYEDAVLIAVDKPPGLPTHATADPSRPNLYDRLREFLARRDGRASPLPYLGLHQRLDRDTSGVILFSKDPTINGALAALFSRRKIVKVYHALTGLPVRPPPGAWRTREPIGGLAAATEFRRLEHLPRGLLVEARPLTGRRHQIRIHLAQAGAPILGDETYGSSAKQPAAPRLMLHAHEIAFAHPVTGAEVCITSSYPEDFRACLRSLREAVSDPVAARRRLR